eukprot:5817389-Heterocapsa_arctica.AAC.1
METVFCVEKRTLESIICGGNAEHSINTVISAISSLCRLDTKKEISQSVFGMLELSRKTGPHSHNQNI